MKSRKTAAAILVIFCGFWTRRTENQTPAPAEERTSGTGTCFKEGNILQPLCSDIPSGGNVLNTLNKRTLSEQIYHILKEDIIYGAVHPGEKLTLKMLQERFQVSSTPIREALTRLTEDCLVTYYSNVGIKVVELDENDIREIYELIGDLDCLAIQYALSSNDDDTLQHLHEDLSNNINEASRCLAEYDLKNWIAYSDRFHLIFYDYCRNQRLRSAADKLRGQLTILSSAYETVPENQLQIHQDHLNIYDAALKGDAGRAALLMQLHLQRSHELALETISGK